MHWALAEVMPAAPPSMTMPVTGVAKAVQAIGTYEALIAQRPARSRFDDFAAGQLGRRRGLLESAGHLQPDASTAWDPCGWAHGDFHDLSVLWGERGQLAAVLDLDRLGPRPYAFSSCER